MTNANTAILVSSHSPSPIQESVGSTPYIVTSPPPDSPTDSEAAWPHQMMLEHVSTILGVDVEEVHRQFPNNRSLLPIDVPPPRVLSPPFVPSAPSYYNPPSFLFYSLPQATSGPVAPPAPTTQIPQNISQPVIPPSIPPRTRTPTLPSTFSQAILAIPIMWPTHTCHHSSMEYFTEPAPVITDPATDSDGDSPMRDRSPSPPHMPYQPRPSGSNVYELEANKQPSPPWKAWLSQPSSPTSITQPISPSSEVLAPKRLRHNDGSYTPITSSATPPISPTSPSAQATPDYQSLPSPRSVGSDQDPNTESPPMLLE